MRVEESLFKRIGKNAGNTIVSYSLKGEKWSALFSFKTYSASMYNSHVSYTIFFRNSLFTKEDVFKI